MGNISAPFNANYHLQSHPVPDPALDAVVYPFSDVLHNTLFS